MLNSISHIRLKHGFSNEFFIGNLANACNEPALRLRGINVVISLLDEDDDLEHFDGIMYHRFNIPDGYGDIVPVAQQVAAVIDGLDEPARIYLHCAMGISRSVSVLIYYIMLKSGTSYAKARKEIRDSRRVAAPVEHYRNQLLAWRDARAEKQ